MKKGSLMAKKQNYTNDDIFALKGADRVRKRPAVIFGSDGLDGCEHSVFEILSNSIDEARNGYGKKIILTKFNDDSIEVEDFGRGCPVDYNQREKRYNWELVSASFMQAVSITPTTAKTMSSHSVLTDLVRALLSILRNIWMLRCAVTDKSILCTLKRETMWAVLKRSPALKNSKPAQRHAGVPTLTFSRI